MRPEIVGIAGIGIKCTNIAAAKHFYGDILGLEEARETFTCETLGPRTCYLIGTRQALEIYPEADDRVNDRLAYITIETTNLLQMRGYLEQQHVSIAGEVEQGPNELRRLAVMDPGGHGIQFIEKPSERSCTPQGHAVSRTPISDRLLHVGIVVSDVERADAFYKGILGFREMWHGGKTSGRLDWISLSVPNGIDRIEYMLTAHEPTRRALRVMHHLALGVRSIQGTYKTLLNRRAQLNGELPKFGNDNRWQLNVFDPDLTRTELLEMDSSDLP